MSINIQEVSAVPAEQDGYLQGNHCTAPVVNYAMPVWGTCAEIHKKKLVRKRLLQLILDASYGTRINELHRAAGCKIINDRLKEAINSSIANAAASEHPHIRALVNRKHFLD